MSSHTTESTDLRKLLESIGVREEDGVSVLSWGRLPRAEQYTVSAIDSGGGVTVLGTVSDTRLPLPESMDGTLVQYRVTGVAGGSDVGSFLVTPLAGKSPDEPADMNTYIRNLSGWNTIAPHDPDRTVPQGSPTKKVVRADNGGYVITTTQEYDMTKTPELLVASDPNADVLWPGALIQGASAKKGGLTQCPITERQPIHLGVTSLEQGIVSQTVTEVRGSKVGDAIREMVAGKAAIPQSVLYRMSEASSTRAALLEMNVSADYLGFHTDVDGSVDRKGKSTTIYAFFLQRAFTVTCDNNGLPDRWFTPDLTNQRLSAYDPEYIGTANPPLWISGVSYGRSLLFAFHTNASSTDAKAALNMVYSNIAASVKGHISAKYQEILDESEVSIIARGGPDADIMALIRESRLKTYFSDGLKMEQCVPISYTLKSLADGSTASMSETTHYATVERSPVQFTFELHPDKTIRLNGENGRVEVPYNGPKSIKKDFSFEAAENQIIKVPFRKDYIFGIPDVVEFTVPVNPELFRHTRSITGTTSKEGFELDYTLTMLYPGPDEWPTA